MITLRYGAYGDQVRTLQETLNNSGFNPGTIDGEFGPATKAAVVSFQRANQLLADGIAGPKTLNALGLYDGTDEQVGIKNVTVDKVATMFPAVSRPGIEQHLPTVLSSLETDGLDDKPMVLMALATIRAETEGFRPISEWKSQYNTSPDGHPFDLYDNRTDLGNRGRPDGDQFKGRGFIQLTGRDNYERYSDRLFRDARLVENPELANDSEIASRLLSAFLGDKEIAIKEALLEGDLKLARRLVNGGRHGLERFEEAYRVGERVL